MSDEIPTLPAGVWRHYKGGLYVVLGIARDDATDEQVVVYVRLYRRDGIPMSVRRLDEFRSTVEVDGVNVPRFVFVGASDPGGASTS